MKFKRIFDAYYKQLAETGSYTPLEEMRDSLLAIAMSRYAGEAQTQP